MFAAFVFAFLYETMKAGITYHYNKPASSRYSQTESEEQRPLVSQEHTIRRVGM